MDLLLTHGYFLAEDPKEREIMKPYAPLGLLYLSSHLRSRGFDVEIYDSTFGSFADPGTALPNATFRVKLGTTTVVVQTKSVTTSNWHLTALLSVRTTGNVGIVAGALAVLVAIHVSESGLYLPPVLR